MIIGMRKISHPTEEPELKFEKVYDDYHEKIHRHLVRMVGEAEAEDLTQEVFAKVSRGLKTFRGESRISTWIYQIATNSALDRIKSKSSVTSDHEPIDSIDNLDQNKVVWIGENKSAVDQQLLRKEMNACIRRVVDRLPENYRTVIVLGELEGFNDNEIAEILGLSLQATKIRLHRARKKLRAELAVHCILYRDDRNELACDLKGSFEVNGK